MFGINLVYFICDTLGILKIFYLVKIILNIVSFAVPIILIFMIVKDMYMNVINPDQKEGVSKISKRLIAAIVIFFVPTVINLTLNLVDYIIGFGGSTDYKTSSCYSNASKDCIDNINSYLNCDDFDSNDENKKCQTYRRCNGYHLVDGCKVATVVDENCSSNSDENTSKYSTSSYQRSSE